MTTKNKTINLMTNEFGALTQTQRRILKCEFNYANEHEGFDELIELGYLDDDGALSWAGYKLLRRQFGETDGVPNCFDLGDGDDDDGPNGYREGYDQY